MARLYANENLPFPVVEELRRLGHDVLTTREAGNAERSLPDDEVLAFAQAADRAVVTLNRRHFVALHRSTAGHPGIVVCTFDADFASQAGRIHGALENAGPLTGQLIRINREQPSARVPR